MSGKPAARVSDPTACPLPGHGSNPIVVGSADVFFDGLAVVALQDGGLAQQEPGPRVLRIARQQFAQRGDGGVETAGVDFQLRQLEAGVEVIGARRDGSGQASVGRSLANRFYNRLASWMTGHVVKDLTSGFRVVRADKFREFLHLLPNGFSYPTTSTMAFFRSAYPVDYVSIRVDKRVGTASHIRPLKDGVRFLLIIFKIATLYSPLKLFAPVGVGFFLLGLGYYGYTFATQHRFTNMSALLLSAAVIVFLIGLISEQITALTYLKARD